MESEVRDNLNLAHYNFNRMAVIDEEANEPSKEQRGRSRGDNLMSAGQNQRVIKNMHNTTSGFYPPKFGDRLPTRGDV